MMKMAEGGNAAKKDRWQNGRGGGTGTAKEREGKREREKKKNKIKKREDRAEEVGGEEGHREPLTLQDVVRFLAHHLEGGTTTPQLVHFRFPGVGVGGGDGGVGGDWWWRCF
jgi:hypothetical protein